MDTTLQLIFGFAFLAMGLNCLFNLIPSLTCLMFPFGTTEKISTKITLIILVPVCTILSGVFLKDHFARWFSINTTTGLCIWLPVGFLVAYGLAYVMAWAIIVDTIKKNKD